MKTTVSLLFITVLSVLWAPVTANPQQVAGNNEAADSAASPVTVSIRQNDHSLCGTAMYDELYALTVEVFAVGAENVNLGEYEQKVFALAIASEEFSGASAEAVIDHIKDIPRQLVEIIREDPTVLDSCSNFSVALIGPP